MENRRRRCADLPIRPEVVGNLVEGAKSIVRGEVKGEPDEFYGQKFVAYDLGFTVMLCDE